MTTFTVTTADNEAYGGGDLAAESTDGTGLSFNEAAGLAGDGDTITFDASLIGQSVLHSFAAFTAVGLTIDGDLDDDGISDITLDSDAGLRFQPGASATLDGMTITGVTHNIPVLVDNATLVVINSIFTGNSDGGDVVPQGIYSDNSILTIQNSRFENSFGPSLVHVNGGTANITDSSFTNNTATGLIVGTGSNVTVSNTVFAHNTAANVHVFNGTATITDSILTGSTFRELRLEGTAVTTIENSIIAGANTSIANTGTSYSLTFVGTNIVANGPGVTYSGTAPTVEPTLTNIFAGVTGSGGTLSALTTDSGATIYTALVNPTGTAQGLGVAYAPTIGGDTSGSITENTASTTGALTISDDNGAAEESFNAGTVAGSYGSLDIAANGGWTYNLNNANATVQALRDGDSLVDTVSVSSADGTTQNIAVTINGVTDSFGPTRPDLSGNSVMENVPGAVIGTLSSTATGGTDISYSVSDDRFEVVDNVLKLKDGVSLDYETEESVSLYVRASNGAGNYSRPFTISVEDVNEKTGSDGADSLTGSGQADYFVGGHGHDAINGQDGSDTLGGGAGDDQVDGGAGDDMIWGGTGNDTLDGGDGDDMLYNGEGADKVSGGGGDDTLWAGAGDDTLSGDEGADTFTFGAASGNDVVTDFDTSEDTLHLAYSGAGFTDLADVEAAASETSVNGASGLLIDLGDGQSIFLSGLSMGDLSNMDITL